MVQKMRNWLLALVVCLVFEQCRSSVLGSQHSDHDHDHDHDHGHEHDKLRSQRADHEEKDWWETTVFYQIYPRSFQDSNGDGVGDLNGITSRLDHLKDMGVGATWLSPIFKSPMYDFGYDISNFYEIDEIFGSMDDFEKLLKKAEELGIKIILDFVPNHSSTESEWFKDSENKVNGKDDWFIWENSNGTDTEGNQIPPNNWVSVFRFSAWEWSEKRKQFYLHQFVKQQPDLNYRNPAVVEEMKNVLRFWLDKGIAGFRVDAINHLFEVDKANFGGRYPDEPRTGYPGQGPDDYGYVDHIYTKDLIETNWMVYEWRKIFDEYTDKGNFTRVMMTEAYTDIKKTMAYYGNETSEGSHMPFNFGLISDANADSWAQDIKYVTDRWLTYMPLGKTANWVIGNHDQWRVGTRYGAERIDGVNMLVLLLPGAGVTYMGEEIGMMNTFISWEDTQDPQACNTQDSINYWKSSRDPARTPFQWNNTVNAGFSTANKTWLPVNENYMNLNLQVQLANNRSHYNIYKNLVKLRSSHTIMYGKHQSVAFNNDVFAFIRFLADHHSYIVVINMSKNNHTIDLNYFDGLQEELKIVEASNSSTKEIGSSVLSKQLKLDGFESLVLQSGAVSLKATGLLLILAFCISKFSRNI